MRKYFAVLAAVAMALALSVGVADARDGHGHSISCTPAAGVSTCNPTLPGGHQLPTCTVVSPALTCSDPFGGLGGGFDRRGPGGPIGPGWPYPGVPQGFPGLINGNLLNLQALGLVGVDVGNVDVCGYQSWNQFDGQFSGRFGGRWGTVRNRFGGNASSEWLALRQAARCSGAFPVPVSGFPTLINGSLLNLNAYGLEGAQPVNVCQYPSWDTFQGQFAPRFGNRFGGFRGRFGGNEGAWRSGWSTLRQQASCSQTVIVNPPSSITNNNNYVSPPATTVEEAPAPTTVEAPAPTTVEAAPAPSSDNPELVVPHGSVASGGFDAAYAASHVER